MVVTAAKRRQSYTCDHGRREWSRPQRSRGSNMNATGSAIDAQSEALDDLRDLSADDLDAVSGGWPIPAIAGAVVRTVQVVQQQGVGGAGGGEVGQGGRGDPAQMFQQIM